MYTALTDKYPEALIDYVLDNFHDYSHYMEPDHVFIPECETALRLEREAACIPVPDALTPEIYADIWNTAVTARRMQTTERR